MDYPTNIKTILKNARKIAREEEKANNLLRAYWKAVSPNNYPPFIERGMTRGYMQAIRDMYGEQVYDDVSYWVYDVPTMAKEKGKVECRGVSGQKYDANNLGSYVKFLLDNQ